MLENYIKKELIFLNLQANNSETLFEKVSQILFEKNYTNEGFQDYITHREKNYPTGLELDDYSVAIPHGDPKYIKEPFISIVTLETPITMNKMEDPDTEIKVDLLFLLGLNDGGQHLDVLRSVMSLIQEEETVQGIRQANRAEEVMKSLTS